MTMLALSATADAAGNATIEVVPNKAGIQWTIGQVNAETIPFRGTASCTIRFNGRFVTNSAILPSSAGGQPFINLQSMDKMTVDFTGMSAGDTAVAAVFLKESLWGAIPDANVV